MAEFYIECINCGAARVTDIHRSVDDFEDKHRQLSGHENYYRGPIPDGRGERAKQVRGLFDSGDTTEEASDA